MARAVISDPKRRAIYEPLYDIDPQTGASVEVFYADHALAKSFGRIRGIVGVTSDDFNLNYCAALGNGQQGDREQDAWNTQGEC